MPGGQYDTKSIIEAVKSQTGFNPALECEKMHSFVTPVLTQISICFDKQLNVMGCEEAHGGIYGRCPEFGQIEIPKSENTSHWGQKGRQNITLLKEIVYKICIF